MFSDIGLLKWQTRGPSVLWTDTHSMGRPLTLKDIVVFLVVDVPYCRFNVFLSHKDSAETTTGFEDEDLGRKAIPTVARWRFRCDPAALGLHWREALIEVVCSWWISNTVPTAIMVWDCSWPMKFLCDKSPCSTAKSDYHVKPHIHSHGKCGFTGQQLCVSDNDQYPNACERVPLARNIKWRRSANK